MIMNTDSLRKPCTPAKPLIAPPLYVYKDLCLCMQQRKHVNLVDRSGHQFQGMINGIQIEDGSGNNWIVTLSSGVRVFVKTTTSDVVRLA
jgi:hypothetical protein